MARKPICKKKKLEVPVDDELIVNQQCALAARKANSILGCFNRSTAGRRRDLITPLFLALVRLHREQRLQLWSPQFKKDIERVEHVSGSTEAIGKTYKEELR